MIQCKVQCIVLTSDTYGRTGSWHAPSCQPKTQKWFGWWTPNGWGWTFWFLLLIMSLYIPYTLIVPDIIYYIIPYISISHCNSNKLHSLTATVINDLITAVPDLFPCSRSFTMGVSIFTSLIRAQNSWALSTPACKRAAVATFCGLMETELAWVRSKDCILTQHNL